MFYSVLQFFQRCNLHTLTVPPKNPQQNPSPKDKMYCIYSEGKV